MIAARWFLRLAGIFFVVACQEEEPPILNTPPVVMTIGAVEISDNSAVIKGKVVDIGNMQIVAFGVYYSKTHINPNTGDSVVLINFLEGNVFSITLKKLEMAKKYYARTFVETTNGIYLGNTIEFTTLYVSPIITDIDGNVYSTVLINDQIWMAENLKTTKYRNGMAIEYPGEKDTVWSNNTSGAYAWFENKISWKDSYGALYNWYAVNNSNGLCPAGWRVPTDADWTDLFNYLHTQGHPNNNVAFGAGSALKSCRQVNSPLGGDCATDDHPRWKDVSFNYGIDVYGFAGLPGGFRSAEFPFIGTFSGLGDYALFYTSTETSPTNAISRDLFAGYGNSDRMSFSKGNGLSIRCMRNL